MKPREKFQLNFFSSIIFLLSFIILMLKLDLSFRDKENPDPMP